MDNPELKNSIAQQFSGLPMEDLIGGPMNAITKANLYLKTDACEKEICKKSDDSKNQYINYMKDTFSCEHDFSSSDSSDSFEFKCPNGKLFSRVYKRKLSTFGFKCDFDFWSIDLKIDSDMITKLDNDRLPYSKSQMDEEDWITLSFFSSLDLEKIYELTESSYNNVK